MTEARRRLTVIALSRIDDLTRSDEFPPGVVDRIRSGYESELARLDHLLETAAPDGDDPGPGAGADATVDGQGVRAERELRLLVIAAERAELDRLLARRRITKRVADGVRATLDVDETSMGP